MSNLKNMTWKSKLLSVLAVIVLVIVGFTGYKTITGNVEETAETTLSEYIRTTTLEKDDITESIETSGVVESSSVTSVTSDLSGTVETVNVSEGDQVSEGDVLVTLESDSINDKIDNEKERLQEVIDSTSERKEDAYNAYEDAKADTETQYDVIIDAENELEAATLLYEEASAEISGAQSDYDIKAADYEVAYEEYVDLLNQSTTLTGEIADLETQISDKETEISSLEETEINAYNEDNDPDVVDYSELDESTEHVTLVSELNDLNTAKTTKMDELTTVNADIALKLSEVSNYEMIMNESNKILMEMKSINNYVEYEADYNAKLKTYETEEALYNSYVEKEETAKDSYDDAIEAYNDAVADTGNLDEYYEDLENTVIRATDSGVITNVNATTGSFISENSTVVSIENADSLEIYVTVEEYDILKVETGMEVYITTDASDEVVSGEVVAVSTTASTNSKTSSFGATVKVTGESESLLIGMNANCEIILSKTEGVYKVPVDAIEEENNNTYVYQMTSGSTFADAEFEKLEVTVGDNNGYYVEINGSELEDGMKIRTNAVLEESVVTEEEVEMGPGADDDSMRSKFGG